MAGEHSHRVSGLDSPHTYCFVATTGKHIDVIGMKADRIHILIVASEDAKRGDVVSAPESCCFVVGSGEEVVPKRSPFNIPDGVIVTFVDNQAAPCVQ